MFKPAVRAGLVGLLVMVCAATGASAAEDEGNFLGLHLDGSLGKGGHSRYVPPVSNFIFNETPYITTELVPLFAYHELSNDFVTGGGNAQVIALQARLAITERLGFIATKDGYSWLNFDNVLPDTDGWNNIAAGLKYNFISIPESESLVTAGLRYEIPVNDLSSGGIELAGDGDGFLNPFVTASTVFGDFGLQGMFGANFALEPDVDNSFVTYSLHADYELFENFFPLIELNGWTAFNQADRLTGALGELDGADYLNFGSDDRGTTVTFGGGFRYRFTEHVLFGVAATTEITDNDQSVFGTRVTTDLVVHF
ncbi:MAG: hypothetical protein AAF495_20800 [Pseudomonadota bacterium]